MGTFSFGNSIFFTCAILLSFFLFFSSGDKKDIHSSEKSNYNKENYETTENTSECKLEDGTYSATVEYNNSKTNYSATYTLDVEVEDCQIIEIDFPNGGHVDSDHISYADIDEDGNASVEGENGKSYQIQIDD